MEEVKILQFDWGGYYEAVKSIEANLTITRVIELDPVFQIFVDLESDSFEKMIHNAALLSEEKINKLNSPLLDDLVYFCEYDSFRTDNEEFIRLLLDKRKIVFKGRNTLGEITRIYKEYDKWASICAKFDLVNMLKILIKNEASFLRLLELSINKNSTKCIAYLASLQINMSDVYAALKSGNFSIIELLVKNSNLPLHDYEVLERISKHKSGVKLISEKMKELQNVT